MQRQFVLASLVVLAATIAAGPAPPASCADLTTRRVDIHVDGGRPIAGERSRFAVSPQGDIYFCYTLAAGDFSCKPLGRINPAGEIHLSAIDSESTWNVEGWATYGHPFDLAFDDAGHLHLAARHRGQPYGVDYWRQVDGVWRLESFGANVTYGGNNVALGLLPDSRPVIVCLDRNKTQLTVWERSAEGQWSAERPAALSNVASGQFDLVVHQDGVLRVLIAPNSGGPICATRDAERQWTTQQIAPAGASRMIAATLDEAERLHVSFASGESSAGIRDLNHATLTSAGMWQTTRLARAPEGRHVGRTDIAAAAGRVAVAWELGAGPSFAPKDYGGAVGSVMLTVVEQGETKTHELVAQHAGRPGLALAADGKTAWVGVYSGNDQGDDFYLLQSGLDEDQLTTAPIVQGDPASMFRDGCLREIDSGNEKAQRRGLQRIDLGSVTASRRQSLIDRFLNHDDPSIRQAIVRELAGSPDSVAHFSDRLAGIAADPDRLVRKTFLENLATGGADPQYVQPVFVEAIGSSDAMTRLTATEVLRQHPDWVPPAALTKALAAFHRDLASNGATLSGSAAMGLERIIDVGDVRARLKALARTGSRLQRVRAALILMRCGDEVELAHLRDVPQQDHELAQLALCGLLGQLRTAECVPLLEQLLQNPHAAVRAAAVYALRSIAHVAELKPVAKHPKGFDLLALRAIDPDTMAVRGAPHAALATLQRALRHDDPNVRQKACDALNRVRGRAAIAALEKLLDDSDPGVRIAARTAVAVFQDRPADALIDHDQWKVAATDRPVHQLNDVDRPPTRLVDGVVQAGSEKQLLIDDLVIDTQKGLTRRLHPFKKHPRNPVFQAQVPWEEGWADPFMSTVIYDPAERCFKLWYRCGPRHSLKGYAVSADGIHWQRPNVARSAWQQFDQHNLLGFQGQIATWKKPGNNVLHFPEAAGRDRFLSLFYQPPTSDYAVSRSPDGVTWEPPQSVRHAYGDVVSLIWDPGRQRYLMFPKYNRQHAGFVRRSFAAAALPELDSPFTATLPFLAGPTDDARVADDACRAYGSLLPDTLRLAEFHSEIYSVTAIPYEGVVVALYDLWPVTGTREGPLDMPMKVSRDMRTWQDVDYPRRALSIGRFGEWDSGMVYGSNTMLVVDDQIRLYYLGANMGHCTRVLPTTKPYHALGVGLATLRLDGFASLQATEEPGQFTTHPLSIAGDRLQINGRCGEGGWIKVELLDQAGQPLPGFALDECDAFRGDALRHTVTWRGESQIPNLPHPVRLRISMSSSDLFAFQFVTAADE